MPWQRLIDALSPSYFPNAAGKRGRPPIGLERMLRIYFLQQWYALADEALEDAIYDSQAMRDFVGIDLAIESIVDATIVAAAPSTKNKDKQRDPEMKQPCSIQRPSILTTSGIGYHSRECPALKSQIPQRLRILLHHPRPR